METEVKYKCTACHQFFSRKDVQVGSRWKLWDGTPRLNYQCRKCNTERLRDMRKRLGMAAVSRARDNYQAKPENKIKIKAWVLARTIPKKPCEVCKKKKKHSSPS